jgi:hypothetical protein
MSYLALVAVAIAIAWWWISRLRVTPAPVAMMAQRIAFPGGLRLADPDRTLALLKNPEEIVIPFEHAILVVDYPLSTPASVPITAAFPVGFTRAELIKVVCEEYANIYEAEEATASTKTVPPEERGAVANRNRTDGAYGIWGHDLRDLVLTGARWTRMPDGTVTIELHVES